MRSYPISQDATGIESMTPWGTAANVLRTGWSMWRGLYPLEMIDQILLAVRAREGDPLAYDTPQRGCMSLDIFTEKSKRQLLTPTLAEALFHVIGAQFYLEQSHSPIYLIRPGERPWVWHQDACVLPENGGCVWIALTDCGVTAPGLAMAQWGEQRKHPAFETEKFAEYVARDDAMAALGCPVVAPVFRPGDAVFFNAYSIHKTHITLDMPDQRIALRLTGFKAQLPK